MNPEAFTTYFNYSQIAGENLEATDLDPFNELGLNEEQRERMNGTVSPRPPARNAPTTKKP